MLSGSGLAADEVRIDATVEPLNPSEGTTVYVNFTITNLMDTNQSSLVLVVRQGTEQVASRPAIFLPPFGNISDGLTFTAQVPNVINTGRGLTLQVQRVTGAPLGLREFPGYHVVKRPDVETPLPILPIVLGVAAAGGAVGFLLLQRRKKAEGARLAAESAAKAEVERRVAAETARELAVTQKIHGKYPAEYYQRRRARLANLVPGGLTSSGLTVLARRVLEQKKIVYSCPRCGTHKESFEAPCPRCSVQDGIGALRAEVKKHRTGADLIDVSDLLQQSEFQLSYSSFGEAGVLVDKARAVFNEILAGGERTVKVKRIGTISASDKRPAALDLGLGTEHSTDDKEAEEHEYEAREEYARESAHCPTCGHAMYGDLCAYCHFDDYATLVADVIAQGAKAGAETVEPRDLLERGRKLRAEDNKSTASRYLNRARYLAKKHLQDHLASKAEGMIDYARTLMLVGEEDGLTADLTDAEATLAQADATRMGGDTASAAELAAKAEAQIHVALHALSKQVAIKRIDAVALEIDDARAKGTNVAAPEAKLKEARAAFDAGEFERARDLGADVKKSLVEATKGKTACPKCGKPVQPTWARCPFCTAPLK